MSFLDAPSRLEVPRRFYELRLSVRSEVLDTQRVDLADVMYRQVLDQIHRRKVERGEWLW